MRTSTVEKKRRRGGQRKPPASRKRNNLTFRTRDQLRAQLEKAATAAGRSISEEIEYRLTSSFSHDDAFGGAAMRRMAILMAVAFHSAGNLTTGGKPVAEWISDPEVFRRAMFGTIYALFSAIPNVTDEDIAIEIEGLKGRLLTNIANRRGA
jgi:hypothetical protein